MTKPVCLIRFNDAHLYEKALARQGLADRFEVYSFKTDQPIPEDLAARAEIFVAHEPDGYLGQMPKLKWIQGNSAGVEDWVYDKNLRPEITLTSGRGSHHVSMPESILGALFHITKQYKRALIAQQESRWTKYVSDTLYGKTLGILGLGAIGEVLARKAAALEMRVIGTKRSPVTVAHVEAIYGPEDTDEVLQQADFVVVLLPSTPATLDFMNAARLRTMKPTAWLLNYARGAAVVDEDLLAAVKSKQIAGAVLDSFREEPLPATHPFWKADNIVVLPHVGGAWAHRGAFVADLFAENAGHFLAGRRLRNEIDRDRGY